MCPKTYWKKACAIQITPSEPVQDLKWHFFWQNGNFSGKMAIFPAKFVPSCTPPPNIHSIGPHINHT